MFLVQLTSWVVATVVCTCVIQMNLVWFAGLGHMHLVAGPDGDTLAAVARLSVIGRLDGRGRTGQRRPGAPPDLALGRALVVPVPHGAQRLHRR